MRNLKSIIMLIFIYNSQPPQIYILILRNNLWKVAVFECRCWWRCLSLVPNFIYMCLVCLSTFLPMLQIAHVACLINRETFALEVYVYIVFQRLTFTLYFRLTRERPDLRTCRLGRELWWRKKKQKQSKCPC